MPARTKLLAQPAAAARAAPVVAASRVDDAATAAGAWHAPSGCACGGGCPRCRGAALQRKPLVSMPGDRLEREADTVADRVMRMALPAPVGGAMTMLKRQCTACEDTGAPRLQREAAPAAAAELDTDTALQAAAQGGVPLSAELRATFEPRFGRPLDGVRVHTGAAAAQGARAVQARAFTLGRDIVFGAGEFAPHTDSGRRLLAHELVHVLQQSGGSAGIARDALADGGAGPSLQDPTAPGIQRDPKPAATVEPAPEPGEDADAKQRKAASQLADHPFFSGLFVDVYRDLRYGTDFSADERGSFKLKGTESSAFDGFLAAGLLPATGIGGTTYGPDFSAKLSTFGKYLDAVEPLTPSTTLKADIASRLLGLRIDEYLASDTFMKRLKDNAHTVAFLALVAQIGVLTKDRASPPSAGASGLADETWNADLLLVKALAGLILKEKLKAPGIFDVGPVLAPNNPLYASDSDLGGNLPSGLNLEASRAAPGAGPGDAQHFGATANIAKFVVPDDRNKLSAADLDDPRKYRGWQASLWGDYQHLQPTSALASQGRLPDRRWRAGTLFGSQGLFLLGEVGGHFSGDDAGKLTSLFVTEGLAYAPAGGPLKKLGFKLTHLGWDAGDNLAPAGPAGTPAAGFANRLQPFASFEFKLGDSGTLGLGGSAGITASSGGGALDLSDLRGDVSYTYLGTHGNAGLPVFRAELSASASRLDYQDPKSPRLYGVRGKVQFDKFYSGAQVNVGADKIAPGRAAQIGDPGDPVPGGRSVLIVFGVLK